MDNKHFSRLALFVAILIMGTQFTYVKAQTTRRTVQQQPRTNISVNASDLLGGLFKKNKDKEESKKEKKEKKKKDKQDEAEPNTVNQQNQKSTPLAKDEVSLVVSGDGATKEEATKAALRSAIELAFGSFVSSNTQILNDELVKDEIITVSSGNVKNYKYLSEKEENGKCYVTIQATVVVGKLVEYTKSKGASAELAGATFATNLKMRKFVANNVERAINVLEKQITPLLENCFSFDEIKVGEPVAKSNAQTNKSYVAVPVEIYVRTNSNLAQARNIADNTAYALAEHLTLPYNFFKEIENVRRSPKYELLQYIGDSYSHYVSKRGKQTKQDQFAAIVKGLANMYIPLESILKFKVVDNLGEYTFHRQMKWKQTVSTAADGGVLIGYLKSDSRISSLRLYDTSKWSQFKEGRYSAPGSPFSSYDYFKPLPPNSQTIDERNRDYQFSVLEGERDIAYVVQLELRYTEEEISKISDIKVLPLSEFPK